MNRKKLFTVALALAFSAASVANGPGRALAAGRVIDAEPMVGVKLRIDGLLREWPGRFSELAETLQGSAKGGDPRVSGKVGYDEKNVYVVLKIADDQIVRTAAAGADEDHATLIIAFPTSGRNMNTYEVDIYPGNPGKTAGAVKKNGAAIAGAKVVEAPGKKGLDVEAQLPWSAFPESAKIRVGLRAALRYTDVDRGSSSKTVIATAAGRAAGALPALRLEAEQALEVSLIGPKNLPARPARQAFGNVSGDSMLERVAVFGNYLTIAGPRYREGKQFYFGELGVASSSMVTRLTLEDVDGDGLQDIVIQKRLGASDRYREVLHVLKVGKDEAPWTAFTHEIAIKTPDGEIANKVRLVKKGKGVDIEVSQGEAEGFDPESYSEPIPSDMPGTLLPWQAVGSATFKWNGKSFEKSGETTSTAKVASKGRKKTTEKAKGPPPPPKPRPPTADELLDRLYALYRKDRGVGRAKPRFDFVTDVAGDDGAERVLVHGKDIVVFGKGFKGGTSFAFITIGVADPKDVLDATARDLTGDGKAEVVVRGVLHAKASKALGGDVVERHALFVYRVSETGIFRIFAAETGRQLGENRIIGSVAMVPVGRAIGIELRPGRALGWSEDTYPFPPDTTAAGGLEPLLLPWGNAGTRRYQFDGASYAQK